MSQEENDLATHVNLCHLRYEQLKEKLDAFDERLTKLEADVSSLKGTMQSGFADIKLILEQQSNARSIQLIATFGTIITAVVALVGYLITK